jgi:hypothetical protein
MAELLQLPAGRPNEYRAVPLIDYVPSQAGYDFAYTLDAADTLVVPVAHHDGTQVRIDGTPVPVHSFENLLAFDAPPGRHRVTVRIKRTPIYTWGLVASGLALLGSGLLLYAHKGDLARREARDDAQVKA